MVRLVVKDIVRERDWTLDLEGDRLLVGRSRDADVCLRDTSVSKSHCRIERLGVAYRFKDLGSRNGTYINELRSDGGPLHDGDELRVGNFVIRFYRDGAAQGQEAPLPFAENDGGEPEEELRDGDTPTPRWDPLEETWPEEKWPEEKWPGAIPAGLPGLAGVPELESRETTPIGGSARRDVPHGGPQAPAPAEAPERPPARASSRAPRAPVALALLLSGVVLGFVLGYAWRGSPEPRASREGPEPGAASPGPAGSLDAGPASSPGGAPPAGGAEPSAVELALERLIATGKFSAAGSGELPFGPPADLADRESSMRGLMRLFLDATGRPPTRQEVKDFLPLSHEERWAGVRDRALSESAEALPESPGEVLERFLGSTAASGEAERALAGYADRPVRLAFLVVSSRLYASREHRRKRSEEQLARSLWVDLLDRIPAADSTALLVRALTEGAVGSPKVVRTLLFSRDATAAGPGARAEADAAEPDAEELATWVEDAYLRFLLRLPNTVERRQTLEEAQQAPDGWRRVLLDLALREEYGTY